MAATLSQVSHGTVVDIAPDKAAYCVFTLLLGPKNAIKLFSVRTKMH